MKLTLLGLVAILGFAALMAIMTKHLRERLIAANMKGGDHDH
jgi:hypothetical protein